MVLIEQNRKRSVDFCDDGNKEGGLEEACIDASVRRGIDRVEVQVVIPRKKIRIVIGEELED